MFAPPGLAVDELVAAHFLIGLREARTLVILPPREHVTVVVASVAVEVAPLIRVPQVAPLLLVPARALKANGLAADLERPCRCHARSDVIPGQPVHRFRMLAVLGIDADALETPVRGWHVARPLQRGREVDFARLALALRDLVVGGEVKGLVRVGVLVRESRLRTLHPVLEAKVLRVRRSAFTVELAGEEDERGVEVTLVDVVVRDQCELRRPVLFRLPALGQLRPEHGDVVASVEVLAEDGDVGPLAEIVGLVELAAVVSVVARERVRCLPGHAFDAEAFKWPCLRRLCVE